jgi:autotransporter-associated beta strand protein
MLGDTSGTAASLNLASANQAVSALTNLSLTAATNLITIGGGQGLIVNGPVVSGYNPISASASSNIVVMTGSGSLVVTNSSLFRVGANDNGTSSSSFDRTILDLSGLAAANVSLGAGGAMYVGDFSGAGAATGPANSTFLLASNTTITAGFLKIGNSQRQIAQNLILGSGSNVLNISTNLLGNTRDYDQVYFNAASGSLRLRSADGNGRTYLVIGPSVGTTFAAPYQFMELGHHYADLRMSVLKVGEDARGSTGSTGYSSNYFGFANGILDTTELRIGNRPGNPASTPALWYNVCNLGGGTVIVGATGITMGTSQGSNGPASTNSAVLNISGGSVTVSNDIVVLTQLSTSGNNAAIGTLNITGGTNTVYGNILCGIGAGSPAAHTATLILNGADALLNLTGHTIGGSNLNPANYLDVLNFQAGTLQNVADINGGANLVKTGAGTLTLAGSNAYSGRTIVSNGTLLVNGTLSTNAVTVTAGTLGGSGIIRGPVTVQSAGTLAPGVNGIATLAISNSLVLQGANLMEIARNGVVRTNDQVRGLATITYGGQIAVTNVGGSPLLAGDSFKLFSATTYAGLLTNVVLPGGGYTWTNRLLIDGTIAVLTVPTLSPPTFSNPVITGGNLILLGSNGTINGTYYLLASTNVSLPLTNWTVLSTNTFDPSGAFSNSVLLNPSLPQSFFLIKQ